VTSIDSIGIINLVENYRSWERAEQIVALELIGGEAGDAS